MLNAKIKLEVMRHAEQEYPRECCGVVTQKGRVQRYYRIDNVHDNPEEHFRMDATQYRDVMDLEENGEQIISIVHSHTGDGATTIPSPADTCFCNEMGVIWTIVSWPEGDMRFVEPKDSPLTGRPWSLGAYDCYGLMMDWHKTQGIALSDRRLPFEWWKPEYSENLYQDHYEEEGFVPTGKQDPEPGDMVIMMLGQNVNKWNHAGIYLGDNKILHHCFGRLSRVDLYNGWYRDHTVLIVRHKELPQCLPQLSV